MQLTLHRTDVILHSHSLHRTDVILHSHSLHRTDVILHSHSLHHTDVILHSHSLHRTVRNSPYIEAVVSRRCAAISDQEHSIFWYSTHTFDQRLYLIMSQVTNVPTN